MSVGGHCCVRVVCMHMGHAYVSGVAWIDACVCGVCSMCVMCMIVMCAKTVVCMICNVWCA